MTDSNLRQPHQTESSEIWRIYGPKEEVRRTNSHYELNVNFFLSLTGGEWNVYSCNVWEQAGTVTESQERKLDMLAQLMELKPGMRVLDVGCGWGGPLCYFANHYGIVGVGISPSATQIAHSSNRAQTLGVPVQFQLVDCLAFDDSAGFDAIYSDEVVVHFDNLVEYFLRMKQLLRPGGRLVTKEAHFANSSFRQVNRLMSFINEIFGGTGHYLTLHDELRQLDEAGFSVRRVMSIPATDYAKTAASWSRNVEHQRSTLEPLVGDETYLRFRTYLRLVQRLFNSGTMTIDIVSAVADITERPLAVRTELLTPRSQ